jgi:hypothetical protein
MNGAMCAAPTVLRGVSLVLTALLLAACDPPAGWLEWGIRRELPRLIGPAERYDVQIQGLRYGVGEADLVIATGLRVRPQDGPVIDRLYVELHGVRYDRARERVQRVERTVATADVTAGDIAAYLELRPEVRSASVALAPPNRAVVSVQPILGGVTIPGATVDLAGELAAEGSEIRFVVSDVSAAGVPLGSDAARRVTEIVNPLVDISGIPIPLRITRVEVVGAAVRVEASSGPTTF